MCSYLKNLCNKVISIVSWAAVVTWTIVRKAVGIPIVMAVLPFRGYARNVVYNYVLANGVYLQRLVARPIIEEDSQYIIQPFHDTQGGYIKKRKISWIEYKLAYYCLWQWFDDDSWFDTWSQNYNETIVVEKSRMQWLPQFIKNDLRRDLDLAPEGGNTFDIGDKRTTTWKYPFWSTFLWTVRNTAYNSKYMTWEKTEGDPGIWLTEFKNWSFGWKAREKGQYINGKLNYDLVAFGWK